MSGWTGWIAANWRALVDGRKIPAPAYLTRPAACGFSALAVATPNGQTADWAISYDDGSRVHVHEFADGRLVVHRDRFDPDRDFGSLIAHLFGETFVGPLALGIVVIAAVTADSK